MLRVLRFLFLLPGFILSQELSNDLIWNGDLDPKTPDKIYSLNNDIQYAILKTNKIKKESSIITFDFKTGVKVSEIANSSKSINTPFYSDYKFSPNENKILLETNMNYIYRRSKSAIYWIYNIDNKKCSLLFAEPVQEPKFSPDGLKIAFVYKRDIYIKDLIGNTFKRVTKDGGRNIINGITDWVYEEEFGYVRAFDWDKSGNYIVFLRFDQSNVPEFSMHINGSGLRPFQYKFKYPKAGEKNSNVKVYSYNINSDKKKEIIIPAKYEYIPRFKFSEQENILSIQTMNRLQNELNLWKFDLSIEEFSILLIEKDEKYVDIHNNLKFKKDGGFFWTSQRDGFNHIYQYSKDGKEISQLTKGKWDVTKFFGFNKSKIYYSSVENDSKNRVIYSIDIKSKKKKKLSPDEGYNGGKFSKNFKFFIHTYEDSFTPPIYTLRSSLNGNKIRIIENNIVLKKKLKEFNLPKKTFSVLSINGFSLNSWLIKPNDFDSNKKYPLLLFQYSGPGSQEVANKWNDKQDYWHMLLAKKGYIILCVDGRGTGFKGSDFKKMTYKNLAFYETIDQIEVAKFFSKKEFIDKERIGIWGWSYGGLISSNAILKGNDIFSLAIAIAPVTNWRFYDTIYTERFMTTPQENSSGYDNNSPLNFAHLLKGKYLLVHGSADDNVHLQNTMAMVDALIQNNKQFEWMIYPDRNHSIFGGNTRIHLFNKMTNFILKNL